MHFHWLLIINASVARSPGGGSCLRRCGGRWLGSPRRRHGAARPELGKEVPPARLTLCPRAPGNISPCYSFTVTSQGGTGRQSCGAGTTLRRGWGGGKGHGQGPGSGGMSGVLGSVPAAGVWRGSLVQEGVKAGEPCWEECLPSQGTSFAKVL